MISYLFLSEVKASKKVIIYGAGNAGIQLSNALKNSREFENLAFIDEAKTLNNKYLGSIRVYSPDKLGKLIKRWNIDEVLVAIPSASRNRLNSILNEVEQYSVRVRILPGVAEVAQGKVSVSELKEIDMNDLLGRSEVLPDNDLLRKDIEGRVVLVTGAGGSIGSELSRQVYNLEPVKLIILDSSEYSLYLIKNELESMNRDIELYSILADVTNKERLKIIFREFGVNTIYHAAAYKHVPLVEQNPFEGIRNNIFGTLSCAQMAVEENVDTFVLISTDKAVRPTNIMGASKRFAEMILQALSLSKENHNTRMLMVRFGNVLGSSGSAIPLFEQQISNGGPITVTHPEIVRYFMSISEASELVIQAGAMGKGGDVFVLDMGDPVKILDLAKRLIFLSGLEVRDESNPNGDIEIIFSGLRPGEKLYEELLIGENVSQTKHKQIWRAEEDTLSKEELFKSLELLQEASFKNDVIALKKILEEVVEGFTSEKEIVDAISVQQKNKGA